MTTFVPAKASTQYITYVALVDQTNTLKFKSNPTIAAGDFKVSIDGGALANLGTLPTVTPAASVMVKYTLSTSEMAGANATVVAIDAAGAEWCDRLDNIPTTANQIDDLALASGVVLTTSAGIKKNTALANYMFAMTDSTNHLPATGLTVTATRSLDGAAFGACANAVSEVSGGWYKISLATTDLNGNTVGLKFTATGADQLNVSIVTGA